MCNRTPSQLTLSSSSALHARTNIEAHPDSEESVQYEQRRVSRELEPHQYDATTREGLESLYAVQDTPSYAGLRSRNTSTHRLRDTSQEQLRRPASAISSASTQLDVPGASDTGGQSMRSTIQVPRWYDPPAKFWTAHVCPSIDEGAYRDHLALERTFLGYLRTSLILIMAGVLIAQLFRLQHSANPNPTFGFYIIGLPLSITFISMAILITLLGALRFWRLQRALQRGNALTGGWEVLVIMGSCGLLVVGTFALVLGVEIEKSYLNN